jgi:hypothetical protein
MRKTIITLNTSKIKSGLYDLNGYLNVDKYWWQIDELIFNLLKPSGNFTYDQV